MVDEVVTNRRCAPWIGLLWSIGSASWLFWLWIALDCGLIEILHISSGDGGIDQNPANSFFFWFAPPAVILAWIVAPALGIFCSRRRWPRWLYFALGFGVFAPVLLAVGDAVLFSNTVLMPWLAFHGLMLVPAFGVGLIVEAFRWYVRRKHEHN